MAGGTEIACGLRARSRTARAALLLDGLPRTGRVLGMTAYAILHNFPMSGRAGWDGFGDPLTLAQQEYLAGARSERACAPDTTLTEADEPLLPCSPRMDASVTPRSPPELADQKRR